MRRVLRHPVELIGSGRTDAGVHAAGMGASFVTTCPIPSERLAHALGSRLPQDIAIVELADAHPEFHARFDAICKLYEYRIHNTRTRPVATLSQRYVYHFWKTLDQERMRAAARHLVGTHDFSSMMGAGCQRKTTVRTVLACNVDQHFDEIRIGVLGTGFLYQQVRIMTGTLLMAGWGKLDPDDVPDILASLDRRQAGPTAPPQGLCLRWVRYPAWKLRLPAQGDLRSGEYDATLDSQSSQAQEEPDRE